MAAAALIFIAALARVGVGMGFISRWTIYPAVALACAYEGFRGSPDMLIVVPVFAAVMALTMGLGWTSWGNRPIMALRYGLPPMLLAIACGIAYPLTPEIMIWAISCAAYGAIDGDIRKRLEPYGFTIFGRQVSSAQYAEFITGAVLLGGMSLL